MKEHLLRGGEYKIEDNELWRRANLNGEATWVCVTKLMSGSVERLLLSLLVESLGE